MLNASKRLLFGATDKLEFKRSATNGIARLWTQKNIPKTDHRYWSEYLRVFDSSADVFSLLGVADIRRALVAAPENICTLVEVLILHLETLRDDPLLSPFPLRSADARNTPMSPLGGAFKIPGLGGRGNSSDAEPPRDRVKELLTCCRILTRLLPVIMEGDHDADCIIEADGGLEPNVSLENDELEYKLLWERPREMPVAPSSKAEPLPTEEGQFAIGDVEDEIDEDAPDGGKKKVVEDPLGATSNPSATESKEEVKEEEEIDVLPSLGERLIEVVVDFLFYTGVTIPWTPELMRTPAEEVNTISRVNFVIWTSGVGSSIDLKGTETMHESHRITVLRLFLVLLSKSIFIPAHLHNRKPNYGLQYVCETLDRSVVLPLLCSLINTVAKSSTREGWMGSLVPNMIKPGTVRDRLANVGSAKEHEGSQVLSALCLQIVNVLLNYESPSIPSNGAPTAASPAGTPTTPGERPHMRTLDSYSADLPKGGPQAPDTRESSLRSNIFRFYISRLHRAVDFTVIWNGIAGILDQAISSGNQLIPISIPIPGAGQDAGSLAPHVPETLMLLWNLLDHNSRFRNFVLDDAYRAPQLLCHLIYFTLLNKDSIAQQGLVRLCIFMLQDVSAERSFAINISKGGSYPKGKLPAKFAPFGGEGSGADLLIQSVYHLLGSTKGVLTSLYPCLVISLTSTSAFWRSLSVTSSARLVQLLASFSSPAFLLSDEGHPRLLYYLLEALTYVVQYQFSSNPNLAYALCARSRPTIRKLSAFTLRRGIAEIRRVRQSKSNINTRLANTASVAAARPSPAQASAAQTPTTPTATSITTAITDEEKKRIQEHEQALEQSNAASGDKEGDGEVPVSEMEAMKVDGTNEAQKEGDPEKQEVIASEDGAEPSDRAKGKMRQETKAAAPPTEEELWAESLNEDELYEAAATLGRNGFVPEEAWVASWQRGLPLATLQAALDELVPKLEAHSATVVGKPNAEERVLAYLREQSLEKVLPQAPPIYARPFQWNEQAAIWLQSYLWGVIYVSSLLPLGVWAGTNARLFSLKIQESNTRRRGPIDPAAGLFNAGSMVSGALGSAIGGLGGLLGGGGNTRS